MDKIDSLVLALASVSCFLPSFFELFATHENRHRNDRRSKNAKLLPMEVIQKIVQENDLVEIEVGEIRSIRPSRNSRKRCWPNTPNAGSPFRKSTAFGWTRPPTGSGRARCRNEVMTYCKGKTDASSTYFFPCYPGVPCLNHLVANSSAYWNA